ncbi:MAG TPA: C4-type zinc ribbon domain-containing protein [bacterium]|nr:C4-type zinc ribbon domain-containing protein [bacterium]
MSAESDARAALDGLWAVLQVDVRLSDARARLAALDDGTALRAATEESRATAAATALRLRQALATLRDQELQLQTTEAKQKKARDDLYGGRISNPKELTALEEEIGAFARARDHLEDQILGLFDQVEALRREDAEARTSLASLEQRLAAHLAEFEAARGRIAGEITAFLAERANRAAAVEPRLLRKYEGIASQEGGVGMVAILGGFCGGCRNTVPPQFVSRIRDGQVMTCERCHRILYLDDA